MAARYIETVVLTLLLFLALSNTIARAGDAATRDIIGFSPDGRYFAFEQHGVQDGSGFPYAEIFVIDAAEDRWVPGTPIRKRIDDEKADERKARDAAHAEAEPILSRLRIGEPGEHLASIPLKESVPTDRIAVNLAKRNAPISVPITFLLKEKILKSEECAKYSDRPVRGFILGVKPVDLTKSYKTLWSERTVILHNDNVLPSSRGCALRYSIADILRHRGSGHYTYVVLLHVQSVGFEGSDSRFLAVGRICLNNDCALSTKP